MGQDLEWAASFAVDLRRAGDERGFLVPLEEGTEIPFGVRRVYYIGGTVEGVSRGFHAHRECRQLAACVQGSCRILLDDGQRRGSVVLSEEGLRALRLEPMIWHEMHDFSRDCVLMILASDLYDEADYIRDYGAFRGLAARAS